MIYMYIIYNPLNRDTYSFIGVSERTYYGLACGFKSSNPRTTQEKRHETRPIRPLFHPLASQETKTSVVGSS